MMEPQPGDFFLAPISGIGGVAIKFGQWLNGDGFLKIQHAGIYLGNDRTIEAMPGGAILGNIERFHPESLVWSTGLWDLTQAQRNSICRMATGMQGTPYSALDYLALALHRFHIPTPLLHYYIQSGGHMICSQLVDRAYHQAGVELFDDGRWDGDVTPGDLYKLMTNEKNYRLGQGI